MEIRKQFKYEMAHVVRNAWSNRCAYSIHGHSYVVEVFISGTKYDNGGMLIDFGLVKKYLNDFIDSFDHACVLWNIEKDRKTIEHFKENFDRVIVTEFPSSAEVQAEMFFRVANQILNYLKQNSQLNNGESLDVEISRVRVHETKTGFAEYTFEDYKYGNGFTDDHILNGIWFLKVLRQIGKTQKF